MEKVFERGGFKEDKSKSSYCKLLLACLRCKCCPKCPSLCDCCKMSFSASDSKYNMEARTVKALQEILFTEAKL